MLGEHEVAYLDYTGSGAETAAHLRDNGRITLMFCSFEGPPKVLRLHGHGRVIQPDQDGWDRLRAAFPDAPEHGLRAIVHVDVARTSDSCGYAVPLLRYEGERDLLTQWAGHKTAEDLVAYREQKNAVSIDGLPALA